MKKLIIIYFLILIYSYGNEFNLSLSAGYSQNAVSACDCYASLYSEKSNESFRLDLDDTEFQLPIYLNSNIEIANKFIYPSIDLGIILKSGYYRAYSGINLEMNLKISKRVSNDFKIGYFVGYMAKSDAGRILSDNHESEDYDYTTDENFRTGDSFSLRGFTQGFLLSDVINLSINDKYTIFLETGINISSNEWDAFAKNENGDDIKLGKYDHEEIMAKVLFVGLGIKFRI